MVALLERSPLRMCLLAGALLAGSVAARPACPREPVLGHHVKCDLRAEKPSRSAAVPDYAPVQARAHAQYQDRQFTAAAATIRTALPADGTDLGSLAELYDQLARAWELGMDRASAAPPAFVALREAWKLDTVLGGAFTVEIRARLADVAPRAALASLGMEDFEAAEQALQTAEVLGISHESLQVVETALARRHR